MLSQLGDIVGERVAALAPKADFSLGDVIDEVHKLREENAALKAQIAILSVAADGVSPMPVIKPLASTSTAAAATEPPPPGRAPLAPVAATAPSSRSEVAVQ